MDAPSPEILEHLQQLLGDSYQIERELSGGGMSRIFVATERSLGRRVVVKTLSPDLASSVSAERFTREIQVVARLQQANIVPLLSAGEVGAPGGAHGGIPYYIMPYVEGESLRQRLADGGAMPVAAAVHVLRDVARALAYAHEHGVVHRDIKPENVLLSGDAAVVTDFGIARAVSQARAPERSATLTAAGMAVGTPAYMAPEQVSGDPTTDHRADIYSFGCLGYELLTGRAPFQGHSAPSLFAAHLTEDPPRLDTLRRDVPPELAVLVMSCLRKRPEERPQSARELLDALDRVGTSRTSARLRSAALVGAATIALAAGALWLARGRLRASEPPAPALAVLPFVNVGGDSAEEYFSDGMIIELTNALARIPGLRLTARSLAFTYKGKAVDVRQVGRELAVGNVLEGTIQRAGDRLRVTAQLTSTADGSTRWSNTYQAEVKDIFAVQDSMARAIVAELRPALAGTTGQVSVGGTTNPKAYDLYLRGSYLLERRGPAVQRAVDFFERALEEDPSFARGYAKLSLSLELLPYFSAVSAATVQPRADAAIARALALDSSIAETHIALALTHAHSYRWRDAERELRRALALDSGTVEGRLQYGRHLMAMGRIDDAIRELRVAKRLDPTFLPAVIWLGHNLRLAGKLDSALEVERSARELDPTLPLGRNILALDLVAAGRREEALAIVQGLEGLPPWIGQSALGAVADPAAVRRVIAKLDATPRDAWMLHTGYLYAYLALGDTARALDALDATVRAHEMTPEWFSFYDPVFDPIRGSARFAAAARAYGLDVDRVTKPIQARSPR